MTIGRSLDVVACSALFLPGSKGGGPIRSLAGVLEEEGQEHRVHLLTSDRDLGDEAPFEGLSGSTVSYGEATVTYLQPGLISLVKSLGKKRRHIDVLYLNSLWSFRFSLVPMGLWRIGFLRPGVVLLAPRGELSQAALALKRWKKRPVGFLLSRVLNSRRVVWQATSVEERAAITRFRAKANILDRSNTWPIPTSFSGYRSNSPLTLIHVARVAPIKNLALALRALNLVTERVVLHLVGTPEDISYWKQCQGLIESLPDNVEVTEHGHLEPAEVGALLSECDGLLLPTRSENFGHAIAEALSRGCVALIPDTTPWTALVERGAGEIIPTDDVTALAAILQRWAELPPDELLARRAQTAQLYTDAYRAQSSRTSLFTEAVAVGYSQAHK